RRRDDRWRQLARQHPRAHHRDRDGDEPRALGAGAGARRDSARDGVCGELGTHRGAAAGPTMNIALRDLVFERAARHVLAIAELDIAPTRTTVLLGPNG